MTPTLDPQGYPTEESLETIRTWVPNKTGTHQEFRDYCGQLWHWPEMWDRERDTDSMDQEIFSVVTGGWSGNESIIEAIQENTIMWTLLWYQSTRGGHYLFYAIN